MSNSEQLLHYVWMNKLYNTDLLITDNGVAIEVLDPGLQNDNAGPDFFNSKIKANGRVWAGNVEIHNASSDWVRHGHNTDKAYNSVILHIAEEIDMEILNENGQVVPQCRVAVSDRLRNNAEYLIKNKCSLPCKNFISSIPSVKINWWLTSLAVERIDRKCDDVYNHLTRFNNSWDDVFYVILCRNFGFGINSEEFERLALSLPYKYLLKHSDSLFQVEALMFGQAGLLEKTEDVGNIKDVSDFKDKNNSVDDYYLNLQKEYRFLKSKYNLKSVEGYLFKKMRVRPVSFPEIRIAQLAAFLQKSGRLFSTLLKMKDYKEFFQHFQTEPSEYWQTHYSFGKGEGRRKKLLGTASLDIIAINTVVPILFAYGKKISNEEYCSKALEILETIKPESNSIVREFTSAGIAPKNALESQALIQLKRAYCEKRKCLYCRIGYSLLSRDK